MEPLGESKSDFQIYLELAKRLGMGFQFCEGSDELDWCKRFFEATDLPDYVSWEEFLKKGYYVLPAPPEAMRDPVSYRWFAEGRPKDTPEPTPLPGCYGEQLGHGLQTQSGKLEFESSSLKRFCPDDPQRLPILKYVPAWEGPHATELYAKYPLHLVSPHPRFTFHTQSDGKDSTINDIRDHRVLIDGYYYWIARINSRDAAARGIRENDLVKLFNDRATVICAAQLTERVPPGMVHSYEASANYDPLGEPGRSADRGGCVNLLTPGRMIIDKSHAMAPCSALIEVARWETAGAESQEAEEVRK
jgi:trimethylamine-N-oxide reductase (cytochrome c)